MFDMIQNKESDMGIEIKEELDVDCTEISNQNFQKEFIQCDKPVFPEFFLQNTPFPIF